MFVVSMKANRGMLIAVAAIGVALAMLLTQCGETAATTATSGETHQTVGYDQTAGEQGETDGTTG